MERQTPSSISNVNQCARCVLRSYDLAANNCVLYLKIVKDTVIYEECVVICHLAHPRRLNAVSKERFPFTGLNK